MIRCDASLSITVRDPSHWGKRFNYTPWDKQQGLPLSKSIEALDQMGMRIIESKDPEAFTEYLQKYENTICGRHPIGVFLQALRQGQAETAQHLLQPICKPLCLELNAARLGF
jgi:hypothetical protein